jgi:hypothetical protein
MSIQSRAYDKTNDGGFPPDPVVVLVAEGTTDVSRLVNALARGNSEQTRQAELIGRQLRRHNGGRAALSLLKRHGGPDFTDEAESMHMGVLVERIAQAICNSLGGDQAWSLMPGTVRDNYLDCARAVVEQIKAPEYVRWCEWPDCLRSFNVLSGPKPETDGKGWIYVRTGMHVLLCPDHADTGHRPQHFEWKSGDTTIRTSCECGERSGDLEPTTNARCTEWWREHVQAVQFEQEEAQS